MAQRVFLILVMMQLGLATLAQQVYNKECRNAPPTNRDDQWGTLYSNQAIRIPFIYDKLEAINGDGLYIAQKEDKTGLIDCDGQTVMPFDYAFIKNWLQPFGKQSGFYVVTRTAQNFWGKDASGNEVLDDWGVINESNEEIIPLEYGYVRVIDADLIVARKDRDTMLHFFSGKGKLLYKVAGRKVMPGYDDQTIQIDRKKQQDVLLYKSGEKVLSETLGYCYWSDGDRYLVRREDKVGLVDKMGKILIPFNYAVLKHHYENDFLFGLSHADSKRLGVFRLGEGEVIEPQFFLEAYDQTFFTYNEKGDSMEVVGKDGKVIFPKDKYWTSIEKNVLNFDRYNFTKIYGKILNQTTGLSALIDLDGQVILPMQFTSIKSATRAHVIIAGIDDGWQLYNSSGELLLTLDCENLAHTSDPQILIAKNEAGKMGLLNINDPVAVQYKFEQLEYLADGLLKAKMDSAYNKYFIVTNTGELFSDKAYYNLRKKDYNSFERFHRTKGTAGELMAIGVVREGTERIEYGINAEGMVFKLVD